MPRSVQRNRKWLLGQIARAAARSDDSPMTPAALAVAQVIQAVVKAGGSTFARLPSALLPPMP